VSLVTVERFDVSQATTSQRPRIVEFTSRAGTLSVHCSREDGSLWLFAVGPRGGGRGTLAFPVARAQALLEWTQDPQKVIGGAEYKMYVKLWTVIIRKHTHILTDSDFRMVFAEDEDAFLELLTALRSWAEAALAHAKADA
jgi:hypothetical protein